ncbi:hypothetical protein K438DRAFT_1963703 [Mycena galopus ATCC 62051]|nr:hypothetical protein K438DRAFT_1963703 [Mycena galopus ATCC 62051]
MGVASRPVVLVLTADNLRTCFAGPPGAPSFDAPDAVCVFRLCACIFHLPWFSYCALLIHPPLHAPAVLYLRWLPCRWSAAYHVLTSPRRSSSMDAAAHRTPRYP